MSFVIDRETERHFEEATRQGACIVPGCDFVLARGPDLERNLICPPHLAELRRQSLLFAEQL